MAQFLHSWALRSALINYRQANPLRSKLSIERHAEHYFKGYQGLSYFPSYSLKFHAQNPHLKSDRQSEPPELVGVTARGAGSPSGNEVAEKEDMLNTQDGKPSSLNTPSNDGQPNLTAFGASGTPSYVQRRKFVVDTGASFNLISRDSLSFEERSLIYETTPITIRTANGMVDANEATSV